MSAVILVSSCAAMMPGLYTYNITRTQDKFDNYILITMKGNYLQDVNIGSAWLNISKYMDNKSRATTYYLQVETSTIDWLFIEAGESLKLLIDGNLVTFAGSGSKDHRHVKTGQYGVACEEMALYSVTPDQIKRIANAKSLEIKIEGRASYLSASFNNDNFDNFRRFIREEMNEQKL
jgi:hypothetical protein